MIGTELLKGQGLGNQLLCYVSARCIAERQGTDFGCVHFSEMGHVLHSDRGMYFMDVAPGQEISEEAAKELIKKREREDRLYLGNSSHDINNGCYISGADPSLFETPDGTILIGNLQSEEYFGAYREQVREWLSLKEEADSHEFTADDLCVINMRGGEYTDSPELYLPRRYWLHAIRNMKKLNPAMRFVIITEDEEAARKLLPEIECHHFDVGKDYASIKNARYLILSNSSFAVLPAFTSMELKYAIAPKYWARHNVSDGYWASEQNIYSFLHYQDRKGRIFTADECRAELEEYKRTSALYQKRNVRPGSVRRFFQTLRAKGIYTGFYCRKILWGIKRRLTPKGV